MIPTFAALLALCLLIAPYVARNTANLDAFRRGMREVGYVEDQHLVIEYRLSRVPAAT